VNRVAPTGPQATTVTPTENTGVTVEKTPVVSPPGAWLCRSCACIEGVRYAYPPSPWVYCARSGCALTPDEQVVALARLQLDRAVPPLLASPTATGTPATAAEPLLMSVAEVAVLFGKKPGAIYKMIERNQLAGVTRVAGRVYVRRADLLRSLAEGRVPSPGRSR
jgi:hypothetical protein